MEASCTISRVRTSRPPWETTSSNAKLSKTSISSGSVCASVETWPGNSSSWYRRAAALMDMSRGLLPVVVNRFCSGGLRSGSQDLLERPGPVHRAIGLGDLVDRRVEVEHQTWIDLPPPHPVQQIGEI